ncbi:MAG: hypothetical protein ACYC1U_02115 [Candidatus Aquicultorales bacterium]
MKVTQSLYKSWFVARFYGLFNLQLIRLYKKITDAKGEPLSKEKASTLNDRRLQAHEDIFAVLKGYGSVCADCDGRCCREEVDRYTSFDNHIHSALDKPLESYSDTILDPVWMLVNGMKHTLAKKAGRTEQPPPCRYLSPTGCRLEKDERPMLCASWFCPTYLRSVDPKDLKRLAGPIKEIESIHKEIARSVR